MLAWLKLIPSKWLALAIEATVLAGLYMLIDYRGYHRADLEWQVKYDKAMQEAESAHAVQQNTIAALADRQSSDSSAALVQINSAATKLKQTYATTGKPLPADCLLDPDRVQLANSFLKTQ